MTLAKTVGAAAVGIVPSTSLPAESASDDQAISFAPAQASNLFLLEDLEDVSRTGKLAESDLNALRAVADWIKTFVARPHKDLGRAGPVCPFVPLALEREKLWLAPERIGDRSLRKLFSS